MLTVSGVSTMLSHNCLRTGETCHGLVTLNMSLNSLSPSPRTWLALVTCFYDAHGEGCSLAAAGAEGAGRRVRLCVTCRRAQGRQVRD